LKDGQKVLEWDLGCVWLSLRVRERKADREKERERERVRDFERQEELGDIARQG
jgi:hypothetical protein